MAIETIPPDPLPDAEVRKSYQPVPWQTFFLGGIFTLMLFWALSVAGEIILPVILAIILKLVLQPVMEVFNRLRIPRLLGSLMIILVLLGGGIGVGTALSTPAASWIEKMPKEMPKIKERLSIVHGPMQPFQKVLLDAQNFAGAELDSKTVVVSMKKPDLLEKILQSTRDFVAGLFQTLMLLFFLLLSGDTFLRRTVEILPRFQDKKQAITISYQIQRDLSVYLMTITGMNALVGIATTAIMFACGVQDPLLWGVIAFLLNYVPIVGPIFSLLAFAMVGLMTQTDMGLALLPAGLYLLLHLVESQIATPLLLSRHFTLNPVLVVASLIFFFWLWGVPGAILATPIIAIIKIICDNIERLKPFGHFIEG